MRVGSDETRSAQPSYTARLVPAATGTPSAPAGRYVFSVIQKEMSAAGLLVVARNPFAPNTTGPIFLFLGTCSVDGACGAVVFFKGDTPVGVLSTGITTQYVSGNGTDMYLDFEIFRNGDKQCCPTGGLKTFHYHWNGTTIQVAGSSIPAAYKVTYVRPGGSIASALAISAASRWT